MNHHCDIEAAELGPFLLGHLDDEDAFDVARRLDHCPHCAAEVARLRPVVAQLRALPADALDDATPTGDTGAAATGWASVEAAVRRERRHHRSRLRTTVLLAVAAAATAAVISSGTFWLQRDGADGRRIELVGESAAASAVLDAGPTGTSIELTVSGLSPDEIYGVWLEPSSGPPNSGRVVPTGG